MNQRKLSISMAHILIAVTVFMMAGWANAEARKKPVRLAMYRAADMTAASEPAFQGPMFIGQFRTRTGCERVRSMPTRPEESFSWCSCNDTSSGRIELVCGFGPG